MSFFSNPENIQLLEDAINQPLTLDISYPVGSLVVYSKNNNRFTIFTPSFNGKMNTNDYVAVGIVLEQLNDYSFIVLNKGFLNQEVLPLYDNITYSSISCSKNYQKDLSAIIAHEFNRYTTFFKNSCNINAIKQLNMMLPSNRHMDIIVHNTADIINGIEKLVGTEKAEIFYNKLLNDRIYCNISGYIAEWKIPKKDNIFYKEPSIHGGYFLPVMHIKLK